MGLCAGPGAFVAGLRAGELARTGLGTGRLQRRTAGVGQRAIAEGLSKDAGARYAHAMHAWPCTCGLALSAEALLDACVGVSSTSWTGCCPGCNTSFNLRVASHTLEVGYEYWAGSLHFEGVASLAVRGLGCERDAALKATRLTLGARRWFVPDVLGHVLEAHSDPTPQFAVLMASSETEGMLLPLEALRQSAPDGRTRWSPQLPTPAQLRDRSRWQRAQLLAGPVWKEAGTGLEFRPRSY